MEEQEIKILHAAVAQFITYGVRSVTMDDVARELAISKKTLYRYVSNKAELVEKCVDFVFNQVKNALYEVQSKSSNAIDELFEFDEQLTMMMQSQQPSIITQLRKYYPDTYTKLIKNRMEFVLALNKHNLDKGISQGIYRPDLHTGYIAIMYYAQTVAFAEDHTVPGNMCGTPEYIKENLTYHIRGIASQKGIAYLTQKLQQQ